MQLVVTHFEVPGIIKIADIIFAFAIIIIERTSGAILYLPIEQYLIIARDS